MGKINMIMAKHESMINVWRQRVMEYKTSGLTAAEWCRLNHFNLENIFLLAEQVWDRGINTMVPNRIARGS